MKKKLIKFAIAKLIEWEGESWNPAGCCHVHQCKTKLKIKSKTKSKTQDKSKIHIHAAPDAIKILHPDEDDGENGILGGLGNKGGDTEYSNRRNHS